MKDLITRLVPILRVPDPDAERRFYERFGLRTTYEGSEYPDFLAVGNEQVEFGFSKADDAPTPQDAITWQLGVADADDVIAVCQRQGFAYEVEEATPGPDWRYRTVVVNSPNGVPVRFEGPNQATASGASR
jgi:catechol 2,3-dioxygenase-like lactoylglutathione lyase family enzyme